MNLNVRKPPKVDKLISKNCNDYELNIATLDQLYKEQLSELRNLVIKKAQPDDIEICNKWLHLFNRVPKAEKMARNCLCTLMQEQIEENGCLQEPFTNLQNCNRNLESILNELDDLISAHLSDKSFLSGTSHTFQSHIFTNNINFEQSLDANSILQELQNVELGTETSKLTRKLQSLNIQLAERQNENVKLKGIAEKFRIEREAFEEMKENIKRSILENIRQILLDVEQRSLLKCQLKFFQKIFTEIPFSNDNDFMDSLGKYDRDLQRIFQKQFKSDLDKQKYFIAHHVCCKFVKSKRKLRQKFERRLTMQNESHKLQLKMAKLNSFSILRQIFINSHHEFGKFEGWEILKALEDKYQNIVNGDLK